MTIKPKLMTAEDLAIVTGRHEFFRVGDVDAVWCIRLLSHIAALQGRLDEAIGQRTACRHTIDQLRAILMPGSSSTSHDDLIAAARELVPEVDRSEIGSPPRAAASNGPWSKIFTYVFSAIASALIAAAITWWLL